jgi:inorganic pyrophosphatase
MILDHVEPGDSVPDNVNVIIEIPTHGEPVKYEVDKNTGAMFVDRFLATAMRYPCNYGYIPQTLSADGDPVDVLVLTPRPLISGSVIRCRPVGVLEMEDEAGDDAKLLAVPIDKLTGIYRNVASFRDLNRETLEQIAHFFEHYKDLEKGKWVRVAGWADVDKAKAEILGSIARYRQELEK